MPRMRFTDRALRAIKPVGATQVDCFDAQLPGFGIRVSPSGRKTWIVMYRAGRRLRRMTLGTYPQVGLADARRYAKQVVGAAARGEDPASEKQAERIADTFGELAVVYLEKHAKRRKKTWREDERILERELLPHWRNRRAKSISRRDVREVVEAVVARGAPIHANRIFALVRKMFNFAMQQDIVEVSPCIGLGQPAPNRQRDRVLSEAELHSVWMSLDGLDPMMSASFRLRILTAQRGVEVLSMRWADIDFESGWWTIPSSVAKNGRSHRVPLTRLGRRILAEVKLRRADAVWVFPNPRRTGPIKSAQKAVERLRATTGVSFAGHDLRRTAASHMTGLGIPRLTVAKILNHAEQGVTAIYDRHSYDREKREALDRWAQHVQDVIEAFRLEEHA